MDRHKIAPYPLRLPRKLRRHIESAAKKDGRSLHAEIISRLELTVDEDIRAQNMSDESIEGITWESLKQINKLAYNTLRLIDNERKLAESNQKIKTAKKKTASDRLS